MAFKWFSLGLFHPYKWSDGPYFSLVFRAQIPTTDPYPNAESSSDARGAFATLVLIRVGLSASSFFCIRHLKPNLVGGWTNSLEKYESNWIISPGRDENRNIWNHHPVTNDRWETNHEDSYLLLENYVIFQLVMLVFKIVNLSPALM